MAKKKKHQPDPPDWLIKRTRKGRVHIDNCSRGYQAGKRYCQVHHVICVTSMSNKTIARQLDDDEDKIEMVKNCLAVTDWDINGSDNVVGLPLKAAFVKRPATKWKGWPCHQVDHNCVDGYTQKVNEDLCQEVWDPINEVAEECEFEATDLIEQLNDRADAWYAFLQKRGSGKDPAGLSADMRGTEKCWKNRIELHKDGKPWYYPFSMKPGTPKEKVPPPRWKDFNADFQKTLKAMLKSVR